MTIIRCLVDEKDKVVRNAQSSESLPEVSLIPLIFKTLEENPNRDALTDCPSGRSWTSLKLKETITRVARCFVDLGLKRGEAVSFYCPNSDYHVIGQMAVMAAGGVYVGCYSTHPYREVHNNVIDSDAVFLVASKSNISVAEEVAIKVPAIRILIIINEDCEETDISDKVLFSQMMSYNPVNGITIPVPVEPNETAAIVFSSGTTGKPKGVIRSHRNMVAYCVQCNHPSFLTIHDIAGALVHQPLPHVGGLMSVANYLYSGSHILINTSYEVVDFMGIVQKYKITVGFLVPSHIVLLVKNPLLSTFDLSSMKDMFTGGAPLQDSVACEAIERLHLKNIRQVYGSSEGGLNTATPKDVFNTKTIGLPLPGVDIKIVDPSTGRALGPNSVGEMYVKSAQVTPAYYKNPEATAAAFTEDGFFKTGDACYYDEEGFFFIVDRYKEVIKVDTQQVAPAEVESVLLGHEAVAEAAVIGIPSQVHGEVPKAYVVLKEGRTVSPSVLIDYVKGQVATWKQLRGGLEFKEVLPKLGLGKIDRKQLKTLAAETQ